MSTASETPQIDMDETMEQSPIPKQKVSKSTKKTAKPRAQKTKSKKASSVEIDDQADVESIYDENPELQSKDAFGKGKKRTSSDVNAANEVEYERDASVQREPPTKKRVTRSVDKDSQLEGGSIMDRVEVKTLDESKREHAQVQVSDGPQSQNKDSGSQSYSNPKASEAPLRSTKYGSNKYEERNRSSEAKDDTGIDDVDVIRPRGGHSQHISGASVAPVRAVKPSRQTDGDAEESTTVQEQTHSKGVPNKRKTKQNEEDHDQDYNNSQSRKSSQAKTHASIDSKDVINSIKAEAARDTQETTAGKKKGKAKNDTTKPKNSKQHELNRQMTDDNGNSEDRNKYSNPESKNVKSAIEYPRGDNKTAHPVNEPDTDSPTNRVASASASHLKLKSQIPQGTPTKTALPISKATGLPSTQKFTPSVSPQSSDAENHPPSDQPSTIKHDIASKKAIGVPLAASTPTTSPSKRNARSGNLNTNHPWNPIDTDEIFLPNLADKDNINLKDVLQAAKGDLTNHEKNLTVEEWIFWNAKNGEEKLRNECERLVGLFEKEGGRAMKALEGIECTE